MWPGGWVAGWHGRLGGEGGDGLWAGAMGGRGARGMGGQSFEYNIGNQIRMSK